MSNSDQRVDRRRSVRSAPKGTVIVRTGDDAHHGRLDSLSRSGLAMTTDAAVAIELVGRKVAVEMRLDGNDAEWLQTTGTIRRVDAASLVVEFAAMSAGLLRCIDDSAAASYRDHEVLSVVVIDGVGERRDAIAEAFRAIGCSVIDLSTPLEAIVRLGESRFEPRVIVIGDSVPAANADDLREFVAREHPHATLVTVGDALREPPGIARWLTSANPGDDLIARVRELLARPTGS